MELIINTFLNLIELWPYDNLIDYFERILQSQNKCFYYYCGTFSNKIIEIILGIDLNAYDQKYSFVFV